MVYKIHMGIPEMEAFWNELQKKVKLGRANNNEETLYKQIGKAMYLLSQNPRHPVPAAGIRNAHRRNTTTS